MKTLVGTSYYVAPEVIKGNEYGVACDCWSLGIILHIMLVGYPPFTGFNKQDIFAKIKYQDLYFDPKDWKPVSKRAKDLVKRLLVKDPAKRI